MAAQFFMPAPEQRLCLVLQSVRCEYYGIHTLGIPPFLAQSLKISKKCLIWNDLYHKAFLGDFLTLCFFCVNCRSQICHSVPFNWKALGSKMPFCHPVALMLWIIWEVFAKAQIPQILLRATSATLQTWQKKVFSRTSPPLISILNSESTTAQKLINILVLPLLIQQKARNM